MATEIITKREDRKPLLEVRNATKRFGSVMALQQVSLSVWPNEIIALLGDNGAGKSTMIKAISGSFELDEGEMFFDGEPVVMRSPQHAQGLGVETVYQDLALFENMSVAENFYAGREISVPPWMGPMGWLKRSNMLEKTRAFLRKLQVNLPDPLAEVGLMSGGQRQATAVARAVSFGKKLLLLDEPTAALGQRESQNVLRLVKDLPNHGIAVVVISHNLDHVMQVCERAIVLRRGHLIGEAVPTSENHELLVSMIVGSAMQENEGR